mmetsp:Transcript_4526/g.10498  ORF Transcript_4526/g.10498 Transcript_4526/m.10498 type:complete len:210 (+) Transcript_4526:153-782(+)
MGPSMSSHSSVRLSGVWGRYIRFSEWPPPQLFHPPLRQHPARLFNTHAIPQPIINVIMSSPFPLGTRWAQSVTQIPQHTFAHTDVLHRRAVTLGVILQLLPAPPGRHVSCGVEHGRLDVGHLGERHEVLELLVVQTVCIRQAHLFGLFLEHLGLHEARQVGQGREGPLHGLERLVLGLLQPLGRNEGRHAVGQLGEELVELRLGGLRLR